MFVSDLVGNPEDRFSRVAAQIIIGATAEMAAVGRDVGYTAKWQNTTPIMAFK